MSEKRFTMCHKQNDLNGWTLSIEDWETNEPFDYATYEVYSESITDTKDEMEDLCLLMNELNDKCKFLEIENESLEDSATKYAELYHKSLKENVQLRKEKELLIKSLSESSRVAVDMLLKENYE